MVVEGLIENMISNGATSEEITNAVESFSRMTEDLKILEELSEKYQPNENDNKSKTLLSYRDYYKSYKKAHFPYVRIKDIIYESREDAKNLIESMIKLIDRYGDASVADLYDLSGMDSDYIMDNKYGWTDKSDINDTLITKLNDDKYLIRFPQAVYLG